MRLGTEANAPLPSPWFATCGEGQATRVRTPDRAVGSGRQLPRSATTSVEHPEANNLVLRELVRPFDP